MNRIDRLSAILIHLQSRRVVKAQDIAKRFNTSLRTVYRDVKALEEAGIPVAGEAGRGYSLMEGYRLPPVMFTREEATAFLTAEKLVEKLTDDYNGASYKSAMYKIKAVLRTAEKDFIEHLDSHIEVLKSKRQMNVRYDLNLLQDVLKSISEKKVLAIRYFSNYKGENTERCVEPVGIFYLDGYWHMVAFCRMRNDYRDFRLDRISGLSISSETFQHQHPSLKHYLDRLYKDRDLHSVVIRVKKKQANYFYEQKYYNGFISETEYGEEVEMTFLTASLEGFARWYLMFADHAKIIKPGSLKERISCIISSILLNL